MPSSRERGDDRALHRVHEVGHPLDRHDRVGHELAGAVVGHAAAAVRVADLDALGAVPVLAHRQVARLGAPALACTRAGARAPAAGPEARPPGAAAERLLERDALPVRDRPELRHPEFGHVPKATLRPSGSRRALLARPHPLAPAGRVDVADVRRRHAGRRPDPAPAPAGRHRRRPDPGDPARHLRQPRADRRPSRPGSPGAPGSAARRRSPAAPPRAQLEVLAGPDRHRACCSRRSSASWPRGWRRVPRSSPRREDTERNAKAFRALILERGDEELIRNLETANTVRLGEDFFRTCVARDDRRALLLRLRRHEQGPARRGRRRQRRAELRLQGRARACRATPARRPARTSNSSSRLRPRRSALSGTMKREVLAAAAARGRSSGPPPGCARSRRARGRGAGRRARPSSGPVTRVGQDLPFRRETCANSPASAAPAARAPVARARAASSRGGRAARGAARSGRPAPRGRRRGSALSAPVPNSRAQRRRQRARRR